MLLEGVQPATAVEEIDGVPVTEKVGMYVALESGPAGRILDDLISPLFGDAAASPRGEYVVVPLHRCFVGTQQDRGAQAVLDEYNSLYAAFPEDPDAISANIAQFDLGGLTDPKARFPEQSQEEAVSFVLGSINQPMCFFWGEVVWEAATEVMGDVSLCQSDT